MRNTSLTKLTAANIATWDERATIHFHDSTGFYAVERFRAGKNILMPIESHEIGEVATKRLLHLQCHIGLETLCLAREGALVTGLDFSNEAIKFAQKLAAETKINAQFLVADIYDALEVLKGGFDIIYVSWGSLNWLPDLWRWAEIVAALLASGGYLYLVDQHPYVSMFREKEGKLELGFRWRTPMHFPIITEAKSTYNDDDRVLVNNHMHEWWHPLSDVIGSLLAAGLALEFFHEHEHIAWKRFSFLVPAKDRMFRLPDEQVGIPLSFSLKATKPS